MSVNLFKRTAQCSHDKSISVISGGIERVICEGCGNVSFRYESMISGDVERAMFAREADRFLVREVQSSVD